MRDPNPAAAAKPAALPAATGGAQAGKTVTLSADAHARLLEQAEQYLRAAAELENTRKRLQREHQDRSRYAAEATIRKLLPIVDSLSQALVAVENQSDPQAVIKGVHLIYRQLLGLLEQEGIKRIATVGERFDPHLHEAVAQVAAQDHAADGTIVEEVQAGYTMHGTVLRPALVKVTKQARPETKDQRPETHS